MDVVVEHCAGIDVHKGHRGDLCAHTRCWWPTRGGHQDLRGNHSAGRPLPFAV